MKKTKIILAALLMFILTATSVYAEGSFIFHKATAIPGGELKVELSLTVDEEINTIGLRDIEYDEDVFTFEGFADYEEIEEKAALCAFDNKNGTVAIGFEEPVTFKDKICSLIFSVNESAEDGKYTIGADASLKYDAEEIECRVIGGAVSVREQICGDITLDYKIDINDALLLLQHSLFPDLYPIEYSGSIDFNGDGEVDLNDAILVLQHSLFPDLYPLEGSENERDFEEGMTVTPEEDAENVGTSEKIVFTFPEKVYTEEGEEVTADYVINTFDIRATSLTGLVVYFDAEVSDDGCTITLIPESNFNYGTKYFVKVSEGILTYADGTYNPSLNISFVTENPAPLDVIIPTTLDGEKTPILAEDAGTGEEMWYIYAWVDGSLKYVPIIDDARTPAIIDDDGNLTDEYADKICTYSVDDGIYTIISAGYDDEAAISRDTDEINSKTDSDGKYYAEGLSGTIENIAGARYQISDFERHATVCEYTEIIIKEYDEESGEIVYVYYDPVAFKNFDETMQLENISFILYNNVTTKTNENLAVLYAEEVYKEVEAKDYRIVSDYEVGEDKDGLWLYYYDLYNPFTGEKVTGVPGTKLASKPSLLSGCYKTGDVILLDDGIVNEDDTDSFYMGHLSETDAVLISDVDEESFTFTAVPYVSNECKMCVDEHVEDGGEIHDILTGSVITNEIKYDSNTAVSTVKSSRRTGIWSDGTISLSDMVAVADADKSLLCWNDKALDRNGNFKKGYADYVKAYIAVDDVQSEEPTALFVIVVANGEELNALDIECGTHI